MLNTIYHYHLQARRVLDSKICLIQRKRKLDQNEVTENQKQYLVQYEPLVVERWALLDLYLFIWLLLFWPTHSTNGPSWSFFETQVCYSSLFH